ncbi:MAG: hypothetical protein UHM85_11070 [Acutalibacteraceae bacterium]|nr:hypothetical protein [Acutalibacteraceae bacterium]
MKKIISVLLTVLMLFTLAVPAFAAEGEAAEAEKYDGLPVVVVRGIDFAGLTYEDGSKALTFNVMELFPLLIDAILAQFMLKEEEALVDGIFGIAESVLSPIAADKEGNSIEPVSMVQYPESMASYPEFTSALSDVTEMGIVKTCINKYGAENTYFFTYDWRKTPGELADELNALIETAKTDSGKDQVNIICASMGCMVTTAYMYYHGHDSINSAVYLSGAHNGTYVAGDALNGRINFDTDVIINIINSNTGNNFFLKLLLKVFDVLGVFDYLTNFFNEFVTENFDKANDLVLRDCMGTLCGFWSLCPDDDFATGVEKIFGGHEEEYAVLLEKLNESEKFVCSTEKTLTDAVNDGVKLTFASNYNIGLVPVYERSNLNGDMVLEAELTSNFATIAPLYKTLDDSYIATRDPKYVSADKVIDASTALFPEYTWFIKDAGHVAADNGSDYSDFAFTLLESEVQPTVDMFPEYPQFMIADENLALSPLK